MSSYRTLLRSSRIAQVATPLSEQINVSKRYPTHQIIETSSSNLFRSEFGMKSKLPSKLKSKYISYNDLDNIYRMPDYEQSSGQYWNGIRFRSMNLPVSTEFEKNPLFHGKTNENNRDLSILKYFNLPKNASATDIMKAFNRNPDLRKEFHKFLMEKYPESFLSKSVSSNYNSESILLSRLHEFLSTAEIKKNSGSYSKLVPRNQDGKISQVAGTAGLGYFLKGRLVNSPNGTERTFVGPSRLVGENSAAIGGFVSEVLSSSINQYRNTKNSIDKHQREFMVPLEVESARLNPSGSVKLKSVTVKTKTESSMSGNFNRIFNAQNNGLRRKGKDRDSKDVQRILEMLNV